MGDVCGVEAEELWELDDTVVCMLEPEEIEEVEEITDEELELEIRLYP